MAGNRNKKLAFEQSGGDRMEELYETYETEDFRGAQLEQIEIETRVKNLMWTVSGDYQLKVKPDTESFVKSKYISLYDAIKQGAFAKYFDQEAMALYIVKKVFMQAHEGSLVYIAQMCVDAAVCRKIMEERVGVSNIRRRAFDQILEHDFDRMVKSPLGQVKATLLRQGLDSGYEPVGKIKSVVDKIRSLEDTTDTMDIIRVVDALYNQEVDPDFEKKHGGLENILSVTLEELSEYDWKDFLEDVSYEDMLEQYMEDVSGAMTQTGEREEGPKEAQAEKKPAALKVVDEKTAKKIYSYVELNYGRSYLSPMEQKKQDYALCRGAHANCSLYFTEGILKSPVKVNYQYKYAQRLAQNNVMEYYDKHRIVKRNIAQLTENLRRSLVQRNERNFMKGVAGSIIPSAVWKIGRTNDPRIFLREVKQDNSEFVVDILMDASGSQSARQSRVAIQGYIIGEALSNVGIPHRVMGFCTFWNYTVMQRYREYDEGREGDKNILNYTASANNRDGLAIRAAAEGLLQRREDNKILIILSDGKPNDNTVNRVGTAMPKPYVGNYGVNDTALEVRKARSMGIMVLGVFTGRESDLEAEKKIFGRDFAYIRDISNFSNIVSVYLKKQMEDG